MNNIEYQKNKVHIIIFSIFFAIGLMIVIYIFTHTTQKNNTNQLASVVEGIIEEPPVRVGTDLLGKAQLSYLGGTEGRNKNIELGMRRIDGTIIAPGEEFSFAKTLGHITEEDGFSKEKMFLNGEVTTGIGGGLCQISSTLFQTVLHAGLPVTERHNHSYSVSYYDVGLDATYSNPGPDLRFINDTDNPIMIKGTTENHMVTFEIYGTDDGRIASTTEAEIVKVVDFPPMKIMHVSALQEGQSQCINTPQIGYTAKVIYSIIYATGRKKEQTFTSVYKPLQRVCFVVGS